MEPEVSVVVLSCGHLVHTARLLETLAVTRGPVFETVLIDNGSRSDVVAALGELAGAELGERLRLRCVFNDTNRGIASGRNQGAALARGRWLLFLDNDTEVFDPEWLTHLTTAALGAPDAGAVGAVLLNADGSVQFAGGSVDATGRASFWTEPRPVSGRTDVGASVYPLGACLLTPRPLWDELGGFDTRFDPMDYEDIDYCLRAAAGGRRSLIALRARLIHHGHVTTGHRPSPRRMRTFITNGRRFLRRWGEFLSGTENRGEKRDAETENA